MESAENSIFKKKLSSELSTALEAAGIIEPTQLQQNTISRVKSGANCICIGPAGCGKSTSILIGVIQSLKSALNDVPRAIIVVSDREKAIELKERFNALVRQSELRVFCAIDGEKHEQQKDKIYAGSDVVIGTARRFNELYSNNGLNLAALKMFVVDDGELVIKNEVHSQIERLAGGVGKAQWLVYGHTYTEKMQRFAENHMGLYEVIEVEE
ncbi:DEAD/DEAH box helicase [Williamwhitmania taraxaci]|uniref:DEAD/DEAH box helicase n=1 Tax=Williamwhitmania taraxaci TaxID=1640674 RepID=A0A1G6H3H0_9BACT|nr:DEAD/DEAH box helicase [Williamwhitmania taraxaci]SDB88703.1 DEAD/DEAH box helicase [Williamwhitmania taraxaci]